MPFSAQHEHTTVSVKTTNTPLAADNERRWCEVQAVADTQPSVVLQREPGVWEAGDEQARPRLPTCGRSYRAPLPCRASCEGHGEAAKHTHRKSLKNKH